MAALVLTPCPKSEAKQGRVTQDPGVCLCPVFQCLCHENWLCAQSVDQDPKSDRAHKTKSGFQVQAPLSIPITVISKDVLPVKPAAGTGLAIQECHRIISFQGLPSPVPPVSHPQTLDLAGLLSKAGGVHNCAVITLELLNLGWLKKIVVVQDMTTRLFALLLKS
jgi:hypothetical protein